MTSGFVLVLSLSSGAGDLSPRTRDTMIRVRLTDDLAGDHLLSDEFLIELPEQLPPGGADPVTGGEHLL